ncbi:MAG: Endonuclease VIII [uncultured Frankineae bacterium]|uniref:DNA-(apurinic or apyrimidinic site) lyase n=1 Tax=uncultured Frankineae bacterium TaxID=437475 RepID=A0A6J4KG83_9ACTN|nr:MAG: Endonuclease VIII [uncultured Frankineae bacterium]
MPEGHLLHRTASELSADLAGSAVAASSPQGRFDAAPVDGCTVTGAEAYGKHLLVHLQDGPAVHVHLGMRGLFLRYPDPATPPRGGVRLRLAGPVAWDLIAPTTCELLDAAGTARLVGTLGPDPLRADASAQEAVARLRTARGPVGAAIVDQAVWAGVGNAWRAELLFLARLDPVTPASSLSQEQAAQLWDLTARSMALGRDAGQVVSDPTAPDERWVYKRETCRSCGAPVRTAQVAGRTSYSCPVEQTG